MEASTRSVLTRGLKAGLPPIYVIDHPRGLPTRVIPMNQATSIFDRYRDEHCIHRLYVPRENLERATALLGG